MSEPFTTHTVELGDQQVSYHRRTAAGEPIVAIPGLGMSADTWLGVLTLVDGPAVVIEPLGSGTSSDLESVPSGDDVAAAVIAVMDDVGWQRAHLGGISMGGMIAQHVAIEHPDRVTSLGLFNTYAHPGPWGAHAWELRLRLIERGDTSTQRLVAALLLTSPEAVEETPGLIELLHDVWDQTPPRPRSYLNQMRFCAGHDTRDFLPDIDLPALVVSASSDLLCTPTAGRELAQLLDCQFDLIEDATHILSNHHPDRLAARWSAFLATVPQPAVADAGVNP